MKLIAWFKKQLFGNELDELQQQKEKEIGNRGYWLAWWLLLAAIVVQGILGSGFNQMAGEWAVFMILCVYGLIEWLRNGIWMPSDTKPSLRKNLVWSVVAALLVLAYTLFVFGPAEWATPDPWLAGLVGGGLSFVLCLALLQAGTVLYYKRRHKLDNPEDDEDDEE